MHPNFGGLASASPAEKAAYQRILSKVGYHFIISEPGVWRLSTGPDGAVREHFLGPGSVILK